MGDIAVEAAVRRLPDHNLQQGQVLPVANRPARIGKYEITDVVGEGGMGAVYKATDPRIGRTVAIKVIKGDFGDNPELLKRFYREAQAVGNLQHPNIVVVYDLGEEHGNPYLVMEYLNGIPLDKIIAQRQSVPLVQKLGIVIEVLNALHHAHQHNIVHRDVKPANVMVLRDGHIKLLDFGIAREGDLGQTKTGQVMGTMWYMSPEQLNSEAVDGRGDVYSTGIMFYELLAYALPFDPRDMTGMIVKRLRGDSVPPLSKYLESYPLELDEIIARALAVDREQRFSTAEEFAFDISRLQERLKRDMVSHFVDEARASIARSDLTKARELLSQVLQVDTQNQTAKQLLYEIQQSLQRTARTEKVKQLQADAVSALSARQLEHAASLIQEAIKLDSTDPDLLNLRELIEQAKSRGQQVKKLLTLAKVAQQTGELVVARKAVDDALSLDPQDTDAKLIQSSIARQLVEYEKQRQIQKFLETARREIAAHQFTAAQENIVHAKAIDPAYPEISGLEQMLKAGREQEARQRDLAQLCSQIEQELSANQPKAARDIAANAMRRFPGDSNLVRLKTAAEGAIEKEERRAYLDERIATASRLVEAGEATRALRMLKDVEREYSTDARLCEYLEVVRQAVVRENAAREKQQLLQQARTAMRSKSFTQAINVLEGGLVQFPEEAEIKDLLKAAREEFEQLSRKKQVEEVSKEAQDLLHSRAHTDAIRLLERTAAQVSDPELTNLLQYAKEEAAKFRAGMQEANQQAIQMLNLGQHSQAVTFLEAQVDKYGKNADFQVLLEKARQQAEDSRRAKERLRSNLKDARAKLKAHDLHSAEALLRVCELEAADEPDVVALAIEIDQEKKTQERQRAEAAERAAREKQEAERRQAEEVQRALLIKQDEERRQREAAERVLQEQRIAAAAQSIDAASATMLDAGAGLGSSSAVVVQSAGPSAVADAKPVLDEALPSLATDFFGIYTAPAEVEAIVHPAVDLPPAVPQPKKLTPGKKEPNKKDKLGGNSSVASETVVTPISAKPAKAAPVQVEAAVEQPWPVAPAKPVLVPPVSPQEPPSPKRMPLLIGAVVAFILLGVLVWKFWPAATHPPVPPTSSKGTVQPAVPVTALLRITGAPPGATYTVGDHTGTIDSDGNASVEAKPQNYSLELDAPGYKHFSQPIALEIGKPATIAARMDPANVAIQFGTLLVKANVTDYRVFVGDRPPIPVRGKEAKLQIPVGSYKFHISKTGYEDSKAVSVKISGDVETKTPLINLKELPPPSPRDASLVIQVRPARATIKIDGGSPVNISDGSYTQKISPASHNIEASADGYQPQTKSLAAKAGDTVPVSFDLVLIPVAKPLPTITASASPDTIEQGGSATIRWNAQNTTHVTIDAFPGKSFDPTGQVEVKPSSDTNYTLTALGPGGEKVEHAKVTVHPKKAEQPQPPPPPQPQKDDKAEIMTALERWRSAYESLDGARLRIAFPNIPDNLLNKIENLRKQNVQVRVAYNGCSDPKFSAGTAGMTCTETLAIEANGTRVPPAARYVALRFTERGDKWVLSNYTLVK